MWWRIIFLTAFMCLWCGALYVLAEHPNIGRDLVGKTTPFPVEPVLYAFWAAIGVIAGIGMIVFTVTHPNQ